MIKLLSFAFIFGFFVGNSFSQECTITTNTTFPNIGSAICTETGTSVNTVNPSTIIIEGSVSTSGNNQTIATTYSYIIANGGSVNFNNNGSTINGSVLIESGGSVNVNNNGSAINGNIKVKDGGGFYLWKHDTYWKWWL